MSEKTFKVDVDEVNAFVKKEAKAARAESEKDANEFASDTGASKRQFLGLDDLDNVSETFCDLWPSVKKLLKYASWIPGFGGIVSQARIVVAAVDKYFVPQICDADQDDGA